MNIAGYAREAAGTGTLRRQTERIRSVYGADIPVFYDVSGSHMQRDLLLTTLKKNDLIVMCEIGCLSDEIGECCRIWKELFEKNIRIVFLKERFLDTDLFKSAVKDRKKENIAILENIAQRQIRAVKETVREAAQARSARTKEGMEKAKKEGRPLGRTKGSRSDSAKAKNARETIRLRARQFGGKSSDAQLMKELSVSRRTYYRYKKELLQSHGQP